MRAISVLVLVAGILASPAYARRGERDGFNFGSTLRMVTADEPSIATNAGGNSKRAASEVHTVRPQLGYVFNGIFHLGMDMTFESESRQESLNGLSEDQKINSEKTSDLTGAGLVSRFLFGRVMYLEAGVGYYERKATVFNEYTTDLGNGAFTGQKEQFKTRAVGMGYHLGGGVEFPIAYGFHFTSNYLVHNYALKPYRMDASIKRDSEQETRRELNFGLNYYYQ